MGNTANLGNQDGAGGNGNQTLAAERLDGRSLRSERSREAVLDAMFELLTEGEVTPGAKEIAERADVSVRTVFRLFDDLDRLFFAAAERQTLRTWHLYLTPAPTGPRSERVRLIAEHRSNLYEQIAPVRRAALRYEPFHTEVHRRISHANRLLRRQLLQTFGIERAAIEGRERDILEASLELTTSFSTWDNLRSGQRLSVATSRDVLAFSLQALLAAVDPIRSSRGGRSKQTG